MPSPHACMPLFTTWYALIPGIILCLTGGIRPYAPTRKISAAMADKVRPVIQAMVGAGTELRRAVEDYAACVNVEDQAASKLVDAKQKLFDKAIGDAAIARDEKPVVIGVAGMRVYQGSDWERKIFKVVLREEVEKRDGSM